MADFEVPPLEHTPWPTPSRAIYGFVLYVSTYIMFVAYVLWALIPDTWLAVIGLTYLPSRHWVITFPLLLCLGVVLALVAFIVRNWLDSPKRFHDDPGDEIKGEWKRIFTEDDLSDLDNPVDFLKTPSTDKTHDE